MPPAGMAAAASSASLAGPAHDSPSGFPAATGSPARVEGMEAGGGCLGSESPAIHSDGKGGSGGLGSESPAGCGAARGALRGSPEADCAQGSGAARCSQPKDGSGAARRSPEGDCSHASGRGEADGGVVEMPGETLNPKRAGDTLCLGSFLSWKCRVSADRRNSG